MNMDADLKKLEKRALLSYFQDGLWDILLGLFIIGWGVGLLTELAYLSGVWFVCLWFLVLGLKKVITYPRAGYVKLSAREFKIKARLALLLGLTALLGGGVLLIFAHDSTPSWLGEYFPLIFCGMVALVVMVVAEWLGARRFLAHAAIIFGAGALHQWGEISWAYTFIVAGAIIDGIGLAVMIKFLRDNPRHREEGPDGDG